MDGVIVAMELGALCPFVDSCVHARTWTLLVLLNIFLDRRLVGVGDTDIVCPAACDTSFLLFKGVMVTVLHGGCRLNTLGFGNLDWIGRATGVID